MNVYGYLIIYVTLLYGEIDIPREQQRTPIADPSLYDNAWKAPAGNSDTTWVIERKERGKHVHFSFFEVRRAFMFT